jgi:glyoxylase-like metal-dependent hydrolase (beta-lactamase superfamily II)
MKGLHWKIGEVEIYQLVEMEENKLFNSFIPEAKPENVKKIKWLTPHFADKDGNLKALVQSFLIKSGGKNVLIDTCNGNDKDRPEFKEWGNLKTNFLNKFDNLGVSLDEIDIVACTHLHFDHVGWNTRKINGKWVPTFPNAKYLFSKQEYDYWIKKPENELIDDHNGIDDSVTPVVEAGLAEFVTDNHKVDKNIRFIPTPGHTPHHISVVIESEGEKAIISGDVLHHPCQMAHQEWTTEADTYPDQTVETRKKFLEGIVNTDTLLIGSHFANPVAGLIKKKGKSMIFKIIE